MKVHMYHVAIYLRLSREDEDIDSSTKSETFSGHTSMPYGKKKEIPSGHTFMPFGRKKESSSISSQRELACSYVREHEDMELFDIYVDDGYSGANFARVR